MQAHTFVLTAVVSSLLPILAYSAEPEPQLPERWRTTPAEDNLLGNFSHDIDGMGHKPKRFISTPAPEKIPAGYAPWWLKGERNAIGKRTTPQSVSLEQLYISAIHHSSQIRVFSDLPLIRQTGIQEAKGAFDTNSFLSAKFARTDEPAGNTLTTGGAARFKQDEWEFEAGIRKKTITGTEISVSQKMFRDDNNSIYFVPNPQTRGTLELNVVQPLLKGAGTGYNRAVLEIAKFDSEVAMSEFLRQSESHLQEVARAYWSLYAARVTYLQKLKLLDETAKLADEIKGRQKLDADNAQIFRAQSAVASRKADLIRSEAAIRNAQDKLKALTDDPSLAEGADVELIPADRLVLNDEPVDAQAAATVALRSRPEIHQAFMQLRSAVEREKMSKNELLPELNLVLQGSLNGLDDGDFGDAYSRQYNTGGPGWGVGFVFSVPLENNAAKARYERRRLEHRQQLSQLQTTVDTVMLEVKISAREVATSYREALAKYSAVTAFTEDIATLQARRDVQTTDPAVAALMSPEATKNAQASQTTDYIDRMIDAQDRRAAAEEDFIQAAANYQVALVNMQRAKGKLLHYENIEVLRDKDANGLPVLYLDKAGSNKNVREAK